MAVVPSVFVVTVATSGVPTRAVRRWQRGSPTCWSCRSGGGSGLLARPALSHSTALVDLHDGVGRGVGHRHEDHRAPEPGQVRRHHDGPVRRREGDDPTATVPVEHVAQGGGRVTRVGDSGLPVVGNDVPTGRVRRPRPARRGCSLGRAGADDAPGTLVPQGRHTRHWVRRSSRRHRRRCRCPARCSGRRGRGRPQPVSRK